MKKKERRNGFTLIELLAVIIILAVIALIATPIVINVVENAQKKAFERSAQGYYDAARYVHNDMMLREDEQDIMFMFENGQQRSDNEKYTLKVQGEVPKKGLVYLSKSGEVAVSIANDKWCAKNNGSGTIELTDDPNDCGYTPEECFTFSDFTLTDDQKTLLNNQNSGFEGMDGTLLQVDSFDKENPSCKGLVIIPSEHNGRKVEGIKSVDLESTPLSSGVFQENTNITGVILPREMKIIGNMAFASSSNLEQVIMNEELRYIGAGAFMVTNLAEVTLSSKVAYIDAIAFFQNRLTELNIPNSVATIEANAFDGNQITSLDIPNTVTRIGENAFANNQIADLKIGEALNSWDTSESFYDAFNNNPLTNLIIKDGVTTIKDNIFSNNHGIVNLTLPNTLISIGANAFSSNLINSLVIPNGVTSIGEGAFLAGQITSVSLPNTLTDIGSMAFYFNQVTSITIPASVKNIGEFAFSENQFENASSITILGDATRFDSTWESIGFPAK